MHSILKRIQWTALFVAVLGAILCIWGFHVEPRQASFSYLFSYLFWFGLTLGSLVLLLLHQLTGGGWGFLIQSLVEAAMKNFPLMALLFIPVAIERAQLYPWAQLEKERLSSVSEPLYHQVRLIYLNSGAFLVRAILILVIWFLLVELAKRWLKAQNAQAVETNPKFTRRLRTFGAPALLAHTLCATILSIDWIMALENQWYSTVFPLLLMVGQVFVALNFIICVLYLVRRYTPWSAMLRPELVLSLGKLVLTLVCLWTYLALSQLIVIWSGNLPQEISWYLHRSASDWKWIIVALGFFHFGVPFFFLLSRKLKKQLSSLVWLAIFLFFVHAVDVYWTVMPSLHQNGIRLSIFDFIFWITIGCLWIAGFCYQLCKTDLLTVTSDPRFAYEVALGH